MGRAGSGSSSGQSSGGQSSGGGHNYGHSSGGHRVGGGSSGRRAGSGSYGGYNTGRSYVRGPRGFVGPRGYYGYGYRRRPGCGVSLVTVVIVAIIVIFALVFSSLSRSDSSVKNTKNREKLKTGNSFMNECIIDELGWFDNKNATSRELKNFFDKTGVQPFIYLKSYDPLLNTDNQKAAWAENYYNTAFNREDIFLYVYFAEPNTDGDVGYMCYIGGTGTKSVMDSEAVEIFWNYLDSEWESDKSTDDLFVSTFNKTANTIMRKSTTGNDVLKWVVIVILIIVIAVIAFKVVKTRRRIEKEKAEETAKILETPLEDLADNYQDDDKKDDKGE